MNYTIAGFLILVLAGCQNSSYRAGQTQNGSQYDSIRQENAQYLTSAGNLVLLSESLSELAMAEAELRNTYVLAEEAYNAANELHEEFQEEGSLKQLTISEELSANNTSYLQELQQIQEEDFDKVYYEYMLSNYSRIIELSNDYLKYGQDESLLGLAAKLRKRATALSEAFEQSFAP